MELILNITWLLIALVSLACWLRRRPGSRADQRRRSAWLRGLGALSYALVLLFPVISLTDDLHADAVVLEEATSGRRALKSVNDERGSSHSSRLGAPPAIVTLQELTGFHGGIVDWISSASARPHGILLPYSSQGRAPPCPA